MNKDSLNFRKIHDAAKKAGAVPMQQLKLVKVYIDSDEMYPVYFLRYEERCGCEVEVTRKKVAEWERIEREYVAMQKEMKQLTEKAYEERMRKEAL